MRTDWTGAGRRRAKRSDAGARVVPCRTRLAPCLRTSRALLLRPTRPPAHPGVVWRALCRAVGIVFMHEYAHLAGWQLALNVGGVLLAIGSLALLSFRVEGRLRASEQPKPAKGAPADEETPLARGETGGRGARCWTGFCCS